MAEQMNGTENARRITVHSDLHAFMEQIDQYTAQLPLTIRRTQAASRTLYTC